MKILITVDQANWLNPIINFYTEAMSKYAEVITAISPFWNSNLKFDIINIQWPEALISVQEYDKNLLNKLEKRLSFWKELGTKIVVTCHNRLPHDQKEFDKEIYNLIYSNADGIIHLGNYSLNEFKISSQYKDKEQIVIYHPNYLDLPNSISKLEARKRLGLNNEDTIFMSFGKIRKQEEEDMLTTAFSMFENKKNKKLIITNSKTLSYKTGRKKPFSRLKYEIRKRRLAARNIEIEGNKFIYDDDIQIYMNAADVIITPRINNLNSGVLFLAYSFKKLTIAPAIGNIKEFQEMLHNPTFDPSSADSLFQAMNSSIELLNTDIAHNNYSFVKKECDNYKIGKEHIDFFKKLIN